MLLINNNNNNNNNNVSTPYIHIASPLKDQSDNIVSGNNWCFLHAHETY